MTTFSIDQDPSVAASGASAGVIASVIANILAAAEMWDRYFVSGNFDIGISLKVEEFGGSTLASGGTSFTYSEGPGLEIGEPATIAEYTAGTDIGAGNDLTITIDESTLLDDEFYFEPDPFDRSTTLPGGKTDFMSVMLHELGHAWGFLSWNSEGMNTTDGPGLDVLPFDLWVDPDAAGGRSFVGPNATALFGGDILLSPASDSHLATGPEGGFENLMDPSLLVGSRSYIAPIHIAILEDIGMPIQKPTNGNDTLFGFDMFADNVSLLDGNDSFDGLTGADTVRGGEGDDNISGGDDNDKLFGDTGRDTLFGGDGDDRLFGKDGNDRIFGGEGNDALFGNANSDILEGGNGDDALRGLGGNDRMNGGLGEDSLIGHTGNDIINGGDDNDVLDGSGGADRLFGENGNDTLFGRDGNDVLEGGDDNDQLFGGKGADTLSGGTGDDSMTGNGGNDVFVFSTGDDRDTLIAFSAGTGSQDVIDLSGMGPAFDTFGEVLAAANDDGFGNTVIDFGSGDTLTIQGVAKSPLATDDFIF